MKALALTAGLVALSALGSPAPAGSWSATSVGGRVSVGEQTLISRPLSPPGPLPASTRVRRLSWHIALLSPPPPELQIRLCTPSLCYPLQSLSGTRPISSPLSASQTFCFHYRVAHPGPLIPALQVVSNQLTLNYQ